MGDPNLEGALTLLSCRDVVVQDCVLACPDQAGRVQTCVTVRPGLQGSSPDGIRIERNRFQVGAWQTAVLVVDSAATVIADNRIQLGPASHGDLIVAKNPTLANELARVLRAGLRAKGGAGIAKVTPAGADTAINVRKGTEAEVITREFAQVTTPAKIARAGGTEKALLAYVRALGQGKQIEDASPALKQVITGLLVQIRAVGQGIVVAGSSVGTARIDGNLVEDTVQGIHVGVSDARMSVRDAADAVVVSRNVVHALVPADYSRDRHGVFVGNARSIHVVDTVATLRRIGSTGRRHATEPRRGDQDPRRARAVPDGTAVEPRGLRRRRPRRAARPGAEDANVARRRDIRRGRRPGARRTGGARRQREEPHVSTSRLQKQAKSTVAPASAPPQRAPIEVGHIDDPAEHEADRVAAGLLRTSPETALERDPTPTAVNSAPPIVQDVLAEPGRPLDAAARQFGRAAPRHGPRRRTHPRRQPRGAVRKRRRC